MKRRHKTDKRGPKIRGAQDKRGQLQEQPGVVNNSHCPQMMFAPQGLLLLRHLGFALVS